MNEIYYPLSMKEASDIMEEQPKLEKTLPEIFDRVPNLINDTDIGHLIQLQTASIERLENTNKSISNCTSMAQDRLITTSKLFKRTAKQLSESKRDLDIIYRKILDLKKKLRVERPEISDQIQEGDYELDEETHIVSAKEVRESPESVTS